RDPEEKRDKQCLINVQAVCLAVPFEWTQEQNAAFQQIKSVLLTAPPLNLPDVAKSFTLYVAEKEGIAIGVLTQTLDMVAKGWPPCLRAVAAAALVSKEARKLTLGQDLTIKPTLLALHTVMLAT
uniref:Reverse transcriptase/retrotransposon-derived protein RNase H-like domain-containing protein n=1 Tax=Anolis carolinensis TaxID=28377 RepID=A0A803TZU9_ANOCA